MNLSRINYKHFRIGRSVFSFTIATPLLTRLIPRGPCTHPQKSLHNEDSALGLNVASLISGERKHGKCIGSDYLDDTTAGVRTNTLCHATEIYYAFTHPDKVIPTDPSNSAFTVLTLVLSVDAKQDLHPFSSLKWHGTQAQVPR